MMGGRGKSVPPAGPAGPVNGFDGRDTDVLPLRQALDRFRGAVRPGGLHRSTIGMNARERRLGLFLIGILALGGGWGWYLLVGRPLSEARDRLASAQTDLEKKQKEVDGVQADIAGVLKRDPRLKDWRKISLSETPKLSPEDLQKGVNFEEKKKSHLGDLQIKYEQFLSDLLLRNGFSRNSIKVTPRTVDSKSAPALPDKRPMYQLFSFSVEGQSNFQGVVNMLQDFHRAQILHQIRGLALKGASNNRQRGNQGDLVLTLTVEALLVTGAEVRETLAPPALPEYHVLAEPERDYYALVAKNFFSGGPAGRLTEDRDLVLNAVRLTMIENDPRERWLATYWDQNRGLEERVLNTRNLTDFAVKDRYNNTLVDGKVVAIDARGVVFKAGDRYYRWECGDYLSETMRKPLRQEEVKSLGLAVAASPEEGTAGTAKAP
jgi:hypothetical protein